MGYLGTGWSQVSTAPGEFQEEKEVTTAICTLLVRQTNPVRIIVCKLQFQYPVCFGSHTIKIIITYRAALFPGCGWSRCMPPGDVATCMFAGRLVHKKILCG